MRDQNDLILYIGKSKKLRSRVRSYFRDSQTLSSRIAMMVQQVTDIEFIVTDTEAEALALEANLVKQHQPYFNVLLKDDKKYPYICITYSEDYPRIFITRKRQLTKAKDKYYGPYVDVGLLRNTLNLVKQIFPQRQRTQPLFKDRPCLNYDIGRCPGVCQKLITSEDYRKTIQKIAMIFQGRNGELLDILTANMEKAAEEMNFELAAKIRDQINGLKSLNAEQKVSLPDDTVSRDAIALAADNKHAAIQLFQIRAGHLVGRLGFFADPESGTPGAILQRVLEEHYQNTEPVEIPTEIIVQYELPEDEILSDYLSSKKGRKVTIITPQRQTKAELIEMVEKNAKYELERTQKISIRNSQAIEDLAKILNLTNLPHRIEGYDISHIQGSNAVASQVVFIDGIPAKQYYRHYKIKNPKITTGYSDDFASLAEVIHRRFRKYDQGVGNGEWGMGEERGVGSGEWGEWGEGGVGDEGSRRETTNPSATKTPTKTNNPSTTKTPTKTNNPSATSVTPSVANFPDLIVIDGGKGQLSAVVATLKEMNLLDNLRVISLAKQREEIFLPGESSPLPTNSQQPGVQLLRRLRDEAHRFAVTFHRQQRSEKMRRSRLDEIPGLGFQRQKQLLAHFHSIDYIREASISQLMEVSGIGNNLATEIYNYFHP